MKKKILNGVLNNGRTIIGVVGGLAIAGASLLAARKPSDADHDYDVVVEWDGTEEEAEFEEVSTEEDSGEE